MAQTKKKKKPNPPSLSVSGKIKVKTHISTSTSTIENEQQLIATAIQYLVQMKGTKGAREMVNNILDGYQKDYQGYFSNYDKEGNLKDGKEKKA